MGSLDIRGELRFGTGRTRDENRTRLTQCRHHASQKLIVDGRVAAVAGIGFVMEVLIRMVAPYERGLALLEVEVKHLGLAVIDPDERVKVVAHGVLLESRVVLIDVGECEASSDASPKNSATADQTSV